jgi:hypothetical protein
MRRKTFVEVHEMKLLIRIMMALLEAAVAMMV